MASEYTKNYNLDLYTDNDKPNLRDQYNSAIREIDEQLHANATAISDNAMAIAAETTRATEAEQTNATAIADETTRAKDAEQANATTIAAEMNRAKNTEQTLQANIDAEKTRAETAEQTLQTGIDAEKTRAESAEQQVKEEFQDSLNKVTANINTYGTVMLAFGDSFSDDSNEWPYLLAAKFGKTCKTYGIGGDVWPFTDGLTNAINDYSTDEKKRTIAFAVAYGGINNIINSPLTEPTSIESFITRFNANFPNVPLYIAPMNQCSPLNTNFPKIYRNAFISANALEVALSHFSGNFILMKQSIFYNTGAIDLWKNDMLHPNEKGSITIANNMATVMQGGTISFPLQQFGNYDTEHLTYSGDIWFDGESIHTPLIKSVNNTRIYFLSNGLRFPAYDNDGTVNNYYVNIPAYYYTSNNVLTLGNQPAKLEIYSDNPQASIVIKLVAPSNSDVVYIQPATINLRNITNIV